jgi:diguanylate cyclase (GGDEF)-like protein
MLGFDPRSFIIISAILGILCSFIFFVLRRSFPKTIQGLEHWAWSCLLTVAAAFLFALRGSIPIIFSSFLANMLVVGGIMLMYASLLRFDNHPIQHKRLLATLAATGLLLLWPTFIEDDYRARVILIGTVNAVLFSACALVIFRMKHKSFAEWFTQAVFLVTAGISLTRSATAVIQTGILHPTTDLSALQHIYLATFSFSLLALSMGFMLMVNRSLQLKLEYAAVHDSLTGLYRREAFFDSLEKEMARSRRYHQPLSLLMIDLDNFKAINDQYGHSGGDQVIVDFSRKAQQVLRTHDVMGRYGGEEFIVALPNTLQDGAYVIAERIRNLLTEARSDGLPAYTVSIGIATMQDSQQEAIVLVNKADQALYVAKRGGKNRIETVL